MTCPERMWALPLIHDLPRVSGPWLGRGPGAVRAPRVPVPGLVSCLPSLAISNASGTALLLSLGTRLLWHLPLKSGWKDQRETAKG